jgi:membrane protease YdiL (CAAX protease family)
LEHQLEQRYAMQQNKGPISWQRRVVMFPLTRIALAFLFVTLAVLVVQLIAVVLPFGPTWREVLSASLTVLASCGAYSAYVRFVERRDPTELALAGALKELGGGVLVGGLLFTATISVLALLGSYRASGVNHWSVLIVPLTTAIVSGFLEEILFRGILFRIAEEGLGTWSALLISALLFGFLHLGNPNATLAGAVAIAVEAGILLAAAYMLTRRLWLAIGIHFAWNFVQGGIFGVAVSGNPTPGLLQGNLTGPVWLSGGAFGAEASIVAVALCLGVGLYFTARAVQRNHIAQPSWRRAPRT